MCVYGGGGGGSALQRNHECSKTSECFDSQIPKVFVINMFKYVHICLNMLKYFATFCLQNLSAPEGLVAWCNWIKSQRI